MSSLSTFMTNLLEDSAQKHGDSSGGSNFMSSTMSQTSTPTSQQQRDAISISAGSQQSADLQKRSTMAKDESLPKSVRDVLQIPPSQNRRQLMRRRQSLAARFNATPKLAATTSDQTRKKAQDDSSIGLSSHSDSSPFDGFSCKNTGTDFNASLSSFMNQLLNESDIEKLIAQDEEGDPSTVGGEAHTTKPQDEGEKGKPCLEHIGDSQRSSKIFADAVESMKRDLSNQGDHLVLDDVKSKSTGKLNRSDLLVQQSQQKKSINSEVVSIDLTDRSSVIKNAKYEQKRSATAQGVSIDITDRGSVTSKSCAESINRIENLMRDDKGLSDGYSLIQAMASNSSMSILQSDNARARLRARSSNNSSGNLMSKRESESSMSFNLSHNNDSQSTALLSVSGLRDELKSSANVSTLRDEMTRLQSRQNIYTHTIDSVGDDEEDEDEKKKEPFKKSHLQKSGIDLDVDIDIEEPRKKRRPRSNTPQSRRDKAATAKRRAKSASHAKSDGRLPSVDLDTGVVSPGRSNTQKRQSSSKRRGRAPSTPKETSSDRKDGTKTPSQRAKTPSSRKSRSVVNPTQRSPSTSGRISRDEPKTPTGRRHRSTTTTRDETKTPTSRRQKRSFDEPKTPSRRHRSRDEPKTPSRRQHSGDGHKTPSRRRRSSVMDEEGHSSKRDKSRSRRDGRTSGGKSGESKREPSRSTRGSRTSLSHDESGVSKSARSTSTKSPSARTTRRTSGDENAPPSSSRSKSVSKRTTRTRTGSPSGRGRRSNANDSGATSRTIRSGSPSARGKRLVSPSARGKRSGSPSARGKRSSATEPKTPSSRKAKEFVEASQTSRGSKFSSDAREKNRFNSEGAMKHRRATDSVSITSSASAKQDGSTLRRSKTADAILLLSPKPKPIHRSQTDSGPPSSPSNATKPTLRRSKTTEDILPAVRPPHNDVPITPRKTTKDTVTRDTVQTPSRTSQRGRRASLGGGGGSDIVGSSHRRTTTGDAARVRAAVLAEAAAATARGKEAEEARAAAAESKPTTRRGTRHRSTAQAQVVLRQALESDKVLNPLAVGIAVMGTKEEAWISRRKNRMAQAQQGQSASEPGLSIVS